MRLEHVTSNPWKRYQASFHGANGGDRRPHQLVPFNAVQALFNLRFKGSKGARDKAFLALLFGGGLRLGEVLGLRLVDFNNNVLRLRNTKRQCAETQVLPGWAADILSDYVRIRRAEGAVDIEPLLINYRAGKPTGDPLVEVTARRLFKRYMVEVGLTGDYSPHCARATAITKLLEDGKNHRDVAKFSRHSTVSMVEKYDKLRTANADIISLELSYTKKQEKE